MSPLRTFLVDDSLPFLESATRFLSGETGLEIIGRALSGREAIEQIPLLYPDLVLMDLIMPGMNGLEATRQIKQQANAPYIIILTLNDSNEYQMAARAVGADGFVSKSEFSTALISLISTLVKRL